MDDLYLNYEPTGPVSKYGQGETHILNQLRMDPSEEGALARQRLNSWIRLWKYDDRAEVLGRLKSGRDETSRGALWEIYVNALLIWQGCEVQRIPAVRNVSTPDFMAKKDGEELFVEATTIQTAHDKRDHEKRFRTLLDYLNKLSHPRYCLGVYVTKAGTSSIHSKTLCRSVIAWLDGLNDEVMHKRGLSLRDEDWEFEFSAIPKAGNDWRMVVMSMSSGASAVKDDLKLRRAIKSKSQSYRKVELDGPIVLVIEEEEGSFGDTLTSRAGALFGDWQVVIDARDGSSRDTRRPNGAWVAGSGLTNSTISGVMVSQHVFLLGSQIRTPQIWLHPEPKHVWKRPFGFDQYVPQGREMVYREGLTEWDGLP
jgi:hypothetical protein